MVRDGLLESTPGRGPGSGVLASAENIAMLLIGMIASVSSSESDLIARSFANAVPGSKCALTGATTFQGALARILLDETLSKRVNEIQFGLIGGYATIFYDGGSWELPLSGLKKPAKLTRQSETSVFVSKKAKGSGVRFEVSLSADTIHELSKATINILSDAERS
jgi:hypothetical protein